CGGGGIGRGDAIEVAAEGVHPGGDACCLHLENVLCGWEDRALDRRGRRGAAREGPDIGPAPGDAGSPRLLGREGHAERGAEVRVADLSEAEGGERQRGEGKLVSKPSYAPHVRVKRFFQ